ncbi:hypothetical protein A5791_02865 [Mycobacterium sp. 852002-51163_SCH5372311]|uniref:hypothetical protein n=1 Tax=Mycobacterium sp. 852002-51163_SCH5372311 TaxID=1834097 RepID=UPI0007FBE5AF|nr:hypothetical protein [Mycobacterium sp. 852002-51163_SCH5372311]OBF83766.1 hypothetical protein A5791_02865 [Mycobacterium sp. 852002-51163_SCH5372311]
MSGGDEERLRIVLDQLARLSGMPPPPVITPDQLATGQSAISQLLRVLGIAANGGDPGDNQAALAGHDEREAKAADALAKFPANEEQSSARLAGVGGQSEMTQMLQQMPQMAAGIAGGFAGALGGALQPLSQIPQQLAQAGQQAMQMGMGALQHGVGGAATEGEAIPAELEAGGGGEEFGGGGSSGGGGGIGPTTPTAMLTPLPGSSAGTLPASSHTTSPAAPSPPEPQTASRGGMGAMPIMPPGMAGAGPGNDPKADTKRVVVPSVKNGAPVQGRITTPPPTPEVIKRVDGKPVATRRILLPEDKRDDDAGSGR